MFDLVITLVVANLVLGLMLSIGLAAKPRDLSEIWHRPRLYVRALLVIEIGVPLLAMAVVSVLGLPPIATGLILLMAICPGAPFIPAKAKAKGEAYSPIGLNLLVLCAVLAPLTVPVWVQILNRVYLAELQIAPTQVLARVVLVVLAPVAVGMVIRALVPRAADVLARIVHYVFLVSLAIALVALLYLGVPVFLDTPPITLLAVVAVVVGSAAMAMWAAAFRPEATHPTVVAAVLGNPGIALAIVTASLPGFRAGAFIAAYLLLRGLALLPIELWIERRRARAPRHVVETRRPVGAT